MRSLKNSLRLTQPPRAMNRNHIAELFASIAARAQNAAAISKLPLAEGDYSSGVTMEAYKDFRMTDLTEIRKAATAIERELFNNKPHK